MTKKRYRVDILNNIMDTNYDWFGRAPPFDQYVIDEEDYLVVGEAKTQDDGEKICSLLNKLTEENEQLKQRINSRLHYYRELYNLFDKNDGFSYDIIERVVEDLKDILR